MKKILVSLILIFSLFAGSLASANNNTLKLQKLFNYVDQKEINNPGFVKKLEQVIKKIKKIDREVCRGSKLGLKDLRRCEMFRKYSHIIYSLDSYVNVRKKFNNFYKKINLYTDNLSFFGYNGKIYILEKPWRSIYNIKLVKNADYNTFRFFGDTELIARDKDTIFRLYQFTYLSEEVGQDFKLLGSKDDVYLKILINGKEYKIDWSKPKGSRIIGYNKNNFTSLKKFLENIKSDFEIVMTYDNLDKINSCDYYYG